MLSSLNFLKIFLSVINTEITDFILKAIPEWNGSMYIKFYWKRSVNDIEWFGLKKVSNASSYVGVNSLSYCSSKFDMMSI